MVTAFHFYFGCTLGEQLLRQTDNLGRGLQDSFTSAAQGKRLTQDVLKTLLKDRTDTSFSRFGARILPRKGKAPVRQEFVEQDTQHFPKTTKDHYKRIYFNAIDTVMQEEILLKSFASERRDTELAEVVKIGFFRVKFCHR